MHTTLQLNPETWDLMLDPGNNIALQKETAFNHDLHSAPVTIASPV